MARSTGSTGLLLAALTVGALVRVALLAIPEAWYDEATTGLMGLAVLRGRFPVYFFGQPFMGALDAYLAAPIYLLLGTSFATLKLLPVLLSIVWMGLGARLAWEIAGVRAALWTAVLLAVPPDFLLYWTHQARTHYPLGLVLGTLALLLAQRAASTPGPRAHLLFLLLGLVLGLGFWTNFLVLVFFPPVILLVARSGARRLVPGTLLVGLAFALGSLPHWLYGLSHGTAIPPTGGALPFRTVLSQLDVFRRVSWPILIGVPADLRPTWAGVTLATTLAAAYGAALFDAPRGKPGRAATVRWLGAALVVLAAINVTVAVGTVYGRALDDHDQRFLLPVYASLMPLLGAWLARQPARRAALIGGAVVLVHAAGAVTGTLQSFAPSVAAAQAARAEGVRRMATALDREGPHHIYDPDVRSRLLTFLSGGRVIVSDPYQEILPELALAVDGTPRIGMVSRSAEFRRNLAAVGVSFGVRSLDGGGSVYADFAVPHHWLVEIDPTRLRVDGSEAPETTGRVVDRRADTFWATAGPQRGGEWLRVDLGATAHVALVRWIPRTFQEVPRGLRLEASLDGAVWRVLVDVPAYRGPLYWSAGRPLQRVRGGRVELRFPPTPARYLRITQTGRDEAWHWTVRELFLYADAGGPSPPETALEGPELARALRHAGVTRLYADQGWAGRAALADPEIRVPPANFFLDAYGLRSSIADLLSPFSWTPGTGVLLEATDVPGFALAARRAGLSADTRPLAGLELFVYAPPSAPPGRPVQVPALAVTASRNPGGASRAVDGDPSTRWATRRPRRAGDWFRIDLATPRPVRALRLTAANPADLPDSLRLEGSIDGTNWWSVPATVHVERALRWGGIALLSDAATAVRLEVEPVVVRALRLLLREGHPVAYWSIHELELRADD